jgi:hypothetical protein
MGLTKLRLTLFFPRLFILEICIFWLTDFSNFFGSRSAFMTYVGSNSELDGYYYPPLTVDSAHADPAANRRVGGKHYTSYQSIDMG